MPKAKSAFFDFIRHVVSGDIDEVSRRLAADPSFANVPSDVGATRQDASTFFFSEIADQSAEQSGIDHKYFLKH